MEIRALKAFLAVAESHSFTRAGARMKVSQSAVSQQVRTLEESLGTPVFVRQSRRVTLTQAGRVLLPYARQILAKVDEARAMISDFEGMGRGRVALGAGGAICHHVLPQLLKEFSARFARIEVQVLAGFSSQTLARTVDGSVDLGIVVLPVSHSGITTLELGRDELVAIAPAGHAWDALDRVRAKDFADERLVVYERSSQTFRAIERFLLEDGVFPRFAMEIDDLDAVKKMVEAGLGVAVVGAWTVRDETADKTLVVRPLGNDGLYRTWGLAHRTSESLTASQRGFVGICRSRFPALIGAAAA